METKTIEKLIAQQPFFAGMDSRLIEILAGCAVNKRFKKGEFLTRYGEEANEFFLIRSGIVAVGMYLQRPEPMIIQKLEAGDILGWSWTVPPYTWHFDAKVMQDASVLVMDAQCLRGKMEADAELGYQMLKRFTPIMSKRMFHTQLQLLDMFERVSVPEET